MNASSAESSALTAQLPAGGSVTIGGETFSWTNFDSIANNLAIIPDPPQEYVAVPAIPAAGLALVSLLLAMLGVLGVRRRFHISA